MGKISTTDKFIESSKIVHGDKYDYSLVEYSGNEVKVKIICKIHGVFEQTPHSHLKGTGCRCCSQKSNSQKQKKLTKEVFIERSKNIHKDKYDYSLVDYKNNRTKVKIICSTHDVFEQLPIHHLIGNGCPKCFYDRMKISQNDFIEKANKIHNNKYDYSLIEYDNSFTKIKIICEEHGVFEQIPNYHLRGCGCSKCYGNYKYSTIEYIEKSNKIHNNKYDYSLIVYKNSTTKIEIICPIHGKFYQAPFNHLMGQGCPICKESYGEKNIAKFLKKNNILYKREKRFENCRYKKTLPFDFYLLKYNICIEYDGKQHFIINDHFGGIKRLSESKKRDEIKNEYCKNNNIRLIRIRYDENIEEILNNELFNI